MEIQLTSFFDGDRSGKIRWLAYELGVDVVEDRIPFSQTQTDAYERRSPLRVVPLVRMGGLELRESTAICHHLVETVKPEFGFPPGATARVDYLTWIATFAENTEAKLVECAVSKGGRLPPEVFAMNEPRLRSRMATLAGMLPEEGYLMGRFSLADIVAAYSFRLAVQTGILERDAVEPWFSRLVERPAAQAANFFAGV